MGRQTDRQTDRMAVGQADRRVNRQTNVLKDGQINRWTNRRTDRWINGQTGEQTNRQAGSHFYKKTQFGLTLFQSRPPPDIQATTTVSTFSPHVMCSLAECSTSKLDVDDSGSGFNSNCQQCLAERAAAASGSIVVPTTQSCRFVTSQGPMP
jgi:hypothetical protein